MVFANGKWVIPLASWFLPVFTIRFMRSQNARKGYFLIVLTTIVPHLIAQDVQIFSSPLVQVVVSIVITVIWILIMNLSLLVDRILYPRLQVHNPGSFVTTLIYPLTATALEFVITSINPSGSWLALAYTQYGNLPLMQLVSLVGLWGITFLINWFGSVINWFWEQDFDWPAIRQGVGIYATVILVVIFFGGARLVLPEPHTGTVRIASMTAVDLLAETGTSEEIIQDRYFDWTIREAQAGAKIVVWSEAAGTVEKETEAALIERGQEVAKQEGIYLAMPIFVNHSDGPPRAIKNKLIIIDPVGDIILDYDKFCATQFQEVRGDAELRVVDTPYGTLSGVICCDMDFPSVIRQAGQNGTDILLAPSLEPFAQLTKMHMRMSVFRAIENGVSVVRQTDNGLSMATDPFGRVLAQVDHFTSSERVMVAQVPTEGVSTLYPVIGDIFGWLSIGGVGVLICWTMILRRKAAGEKSIAPEEQD
jgi:apolipoprotein N-acyltransferase